MKRICIISCLFLAFPAFAQKDAKAKEWLDKSSGAFGKAGALSVDFTLNIKDVSNKVAESFDGTIDLKDTRFHLNVPEMETWFDGKTQWVLQKVWDEVNVSEPTAQEAQALNPAVIFSIYKKGCNYQYRGEKTDIKGRKVQEVELMPQAKKSDMEKIVMQIAPGDFLPVKIHIFYKNKLENIIHINQYRKNPNLPDSVFVFDKKKYPNVEIIDLR
ncbi:MAG: outer-membrane lipoprotein carrier protein LolA [Dysgonamonadaceae bacterium]|jgi:outer membrane lipoprotein-sorting protein|nr:outer-membrane lipoprotein carrier protein LolA [Dysgonamonadaceae bacterium]